MNTMENLNLLIKIHKLWYILLTVISKTYICVSVTLYMQFSMHQMLFFRSRWYWITIKITKLHELHFCFVYTLAWTKEDSVIKLSHGKVGRFSSPKRTVWWFGQNRQFWGWSWMEQIFCLVCICTWRGKFEEHKNK